VREQTLESVQLTLRLPNFSSSFIHTQSHVDEVLVKQNKKATTTQESIERCTRIQATLPVACTLRRASRSSTYHSRVSPIKSISIRTSVSEREAQRVQSVDRLPKL
jgi:hypothetical protein